MNAFMVNRTYTPIPPRAIPAPLSAASAIVTGKVYQKHAEHVQCDRFLYRFLQHPARLCIALAVALGYD